MAKISFEWEDCWAYYPYAQKETQSDILIALKGFLETSSPTAQKKALESAPMGVIKAHSHLLHDKAKKALGVKEIFTYSW